MTATTQAHPTRLLVTDVDSTLITSEVIELLAHHAGTYATVAALTESAMRGELDFAESLHQRVATLAGLPVQSLAQVYADIEFTPGARELVAGAHQRGWEVALVSGGFTEIVAMLAAGLGITRVHANTLEIRDGLLTGRVQGPVVDRAAKARALAQYADELGLDRTRTIAIGDGANDLDMIAAAGIGIAFNAKPLVRAQAPHILDGRLDGALTLIDEIDRASPAQGAGTAGGSSASSSH